MRPPPLPSDLTEAALTLCSQCRFICCPTAM